MCLENGSLKIGLLCQGHDQKSYFDILSHSVVDSRQRNENIRKMNQNTTLKEIIICERRL